MTQVDHAPASDFGRFLADLREGARRQGNVIFALIFREVKVKIGADGHGLLSFVGILLEPVAAVAALAAFFYLLKRQEIMGIHVALFLAVSYPPFMFLRRCITSVPRAIHSSRSFYAFQSVKPFDAVIARYVIELILTLTGTIFLLFLLWWFMDLTIHTNALLEALGLLGALLCGGLGMALFLGVYGTRFPVIYKTITLVGRGMVLLSAVIHPFNELTPEARAILVWNPIAHFEELFRVELLGTTAFTGLSLNYFLMWSIISLFLGFVGYYNNRFKVLER
ncbi:MAG TPA: ABC transporter permease [Aestuariivirga sp.]|nr:ABC transporter permease [Alphaproteobacteria bacterium]HRX35118.1 ABC transporter permease [Aestuariivirga sp.]